MLSSCHQSSLSSVPNYDQCDASYIWLNFFVCVGILDVLCVCVCACFSIACPSYCDDVRRRITRKPFSLLCVQVTRRFGVSGLKAAMEDLGYFGGPTRLPMLPLSQSQLSTQREVFKESGYMCS